MKIKRVDLIGKFDPNGTAALRSTAGGRFRESLMRPDGMAPVSIVPTAQLDALIKVAEAAQRFRDHAAVTIHDYGVPLWGDLKRAIAALDAATAEPEAKR